MNSNPETVSTDYDTSSRLYFEPLTIEDVLNVIEKERPEGIIIQFGGQTPLKLANAIQKALTDNPLPAASGMLIHVLHVLDWQRVMTGNTCCLLLHAGHALLSASVLAHQCCPSPHLPCPSYQNTSGTMLVHPQ